MQVEISKEVLNNLLIFLDRIEIKGLKEIQAMNQILDALTPKEQVQEIKSQK